MSSFRAILLVGCVVLALASAQSCEDVPTTGVCASYVSTYAHGKYILVNGKTGTDPTPKINAILNIPLCESCHENLIRLICKITYPEATSASCSPIGAKIPSQTTCTESFDGCVPASIPEPARSQVLSAIQSGTGSCESIYLNFEPLGSLLTQYDDALTPQANCSCTTPAVTDNLGLCTGVIDYPVWSALTYFNASVSSGIQTVYDQTLSSLNSVEGLACANCTAQVKQTFCSAAFLKCDIASGNLGVLPCQSNCDAIMNACRINDLTDPAIVSFLNQTAPGVNMPALNSISSICTSTGLFSNDMGCNADLPPKDRCPCVKPTFITGSVCEPYVNFTVFPVLAHMSSTLEQTVSSSLSLLSGFAADIICDSCKESLTEVACLSAFPRCSDTTAITAVCTDSCVSILSPCGLPSLERFCTEGPTTALPQDTCVNVSPQSSDVPCTFCGSRTDLANCGSLLDWPSFIVDVPGLDIAAYDRLFSSFFTTVSYPSCPTCTHQIKQIIDSLVATFSEQPPTKDEVLAMLPRPCHSKCTEVFDNCLLTLNTSSAAPFFSCDSDFGSTFDIELFSKNADTCYSHQYPALPPPSCPILRGVAPTEEMVTEGVAPGVVAALVICFAVLPILGAIVVVVLWAWKLWIFKIPKESEMQGGEGGYYYDEAEDVELTPQQPQTRDTWTKSQAPSRATNVAED